MGKPCIVI